MSRKSEIGQRAEKRILRYGKCPRCAREFVGMPHSFPVYDLQCSSCKVVVNVKATDGEDTHRTHRQGYKPYLEWLDAGGKERFFYFACVTRSGKVVWRNAADGRQYLSYMVRQGRRTSVGAYIWKCWLQNRPPCETEMIQWIF